MSNPLSGAFQKMELDKLLGHHGTAHKVRAVPKNQSNPVQLTSLQYREKFNVRYYPWLRFKDEDSLNHVLKNCPWLLKNTFWGAENREFATVYHQELEEGYVANVTIKWIDEELGYGVFTNQPLEPGDYVGEFTGDVRPLLRSKPDQNEYCFHYPTRFWSKDYYVVDALNGGNEMRFINHSDQPNLTPFCILDRQLQHIVFFANQKINPGTQLTYNYGKDYWRHRKKIPI